MTVLRHITKADLTEICGWNLSAQDLQFWASISNKDDLHTKLSSWMLEGLVNAFVLEILGEIIGYGELWKDDREVEIARVLINPRRRRQGFGQVLAKCLLGEARTMSDNVWLRVHPDNGGARSLYSTLGFRRASDEQELEFNLSQPNQYEWMKAVILQPPENGFLRPQGPANPEGEYLVMRIPDPRKPN